jgi:pimeloyl-ACP methyl ester carboxylesterase
MPLAPINGIEIAYETFGEPSAPPLLLIMGLSAQMIHWDEEFCSALAGYGYYVIRFDNRDCGLSTKFHGLPNLLAVMSGDPSTAPYRLADMAADAAGLLDHLGIDAAHVVGASMGGMIAQTLAIDAPERCLSLTSIMSTTGAPDVGAPSPELVTLLLSPPAVGREAAIEKSMGTTRAIASTGVPFDEDRARRNVTAAIDRCFCPEGSVRQLSAIVASGDRTEALRQLRVPTLVIHGDPDPLVGTSGGHATAAAVPDADLLIIAGMGHEIPPAYRDEVLQAIAEHAGANTRRVGADASAS